MRNAMTNTRGPAYYTVRETAWILGVEPSSISRAIRLGTLRAVPRYSRLVVPASALAQLLGDRIDGRDASTATPHVERSHDAGRRPQSGGAR
jgi:hypothetical protein